MLSNPLQRFPAYNTLPLTNMMPTGHVPSNHMHANGFDALSHGSQYALQQLQRQIDGHQNPHVVRAGGLKHRQHPYGHITSTSIQMPSGNSSAGPVRRRISRACDQCNQLRTKCDGQNPCAHCVEFNLGCEYIRERKKRGKASRKDLAQQAAAAAAGSTDQKSPSGNSSDSVSEPRVGSNPEGVTDENRLRGQPESRSMSLDNAQANKTASLRKAMKASRARSVSNLTDTSQPHFIHGHQDESLNLDPGGNSARTGFNGYGSMHTFNRSTVNQGHLLGNANFAAHGMVGYHDIPFSIQSPPNFQTGAPSPGGPFRMGDTAISDFAIDSPLNSGPSPSWLSLQSPSQHSYNHTLRYPVLQPLLAHIDGIVSLPLACDLLDLYFASSSSAQIHPMSPYVLGHVFRKQSFLHPTKPRQCTPALLASILWVAAQTSEAALLTSSPSARGRVCQRLLELTVGLLKPLIHGPTLASPPVDFADTVINGVALGGLGVATSSTTHAAGMHGDNATIGAAGQLDDVVTYIHLATVVSASEYKGASLRWWNAAWSLARELKLGRELHPSAQSHDNDLDADGEADDDLNHSDQQHRFPGHIAEEEREERRRIWWLLYTVDRHLSLCYNKPLFLMDIECEDLLQPMEDLMWQAGEFYSGDSNLHYNSPNGSTFIRRHGPNFECTGHSIFGYFLPLMTILGEIVDLHHAKNHPRFGIGFRSAQEWDDHADEIASQLGAYGRSLQEFEARNLHRHESDGLQGDRQDGRDDQESPVTHSANINPAHITESDLQTRIVVAYGTHVMHVLHVLLTGKWDPISLLDDNDLWISSQSFIDATRHAVSAAEAIEHILEYDPGLEFMPFFFGVYLLQGSFLLLLIADKLQSEASPSVVRACEIIVRAHEACVVTLNTEYQRNFRKVMRSALAQVKGRVAEDFGEQQLRRREVLSLYRWVGNGTGLAL